MITSRGCTERCGDSLAHAVFRESPYPKHPDLFGSFPSAAAGEKYVSLSCSLFPHILTAPVTDDGSHLTVPLLQ
jgi:hypothetical protein